LWTIATRRAFAVRAAGEPNLERAAKRLRIAVHVGDYRARGAVCVREVVVVCEGTLVDASQLCFARCLEAQRFDMREPDAYANRRHAIVRLGLAREERFERHSRIGVAGAKAQRRDAHEATCLFLDIATAFVDRGGGVVRSQSCGIGSERDPAFSDLLEQSRARRLGGVERAERR